MFKFFQKNRDKNPSNSPDKISVYKSTSTIMAAFLQEMGIYETPLKLMKPPVLAYLYGWCDATVQIQRPNPAEGLAMMVAMFDDIYGRIMFADGTTSSETSAIAYKQALKIVKNPNNRYASWVITGGNELNALLSSGTPPMGILEALDAAV